MKYVESRAKSLDEAVEKVAVYWADQDERVMIATLDGRLVTDHRPMTRITVTVTARVGDVAIHGFLRPGAVAEDARVLMTLDDLDATPALVEKSFGSGATLALISVPGEHAAAEARPTKLWIGGKLVVAGS